MRRKSIPIVFAALLIATSSAHASFFPGSSLKSDADRDPAGDAIAAIVNVSMVQEITDWVKGFHSEEGAIAGEDLAENEGCKEDAKAPAKKTGKRSSKKEKPEDGEDSKPSGPEPIYFGF